MLDISRRGFFGLAAGTVAVFALGPSSVVEAAAEPVSAALPIIIGPQLIADEMARQLVKLGVCGGAPKTKMQSCVDLDIPTHSLTMSVDEFVERHLEPAAHSLARCLGRTGNGLVLPHGIDWGCFGRAGDVEVRFLRCYDINQDKYLYHFDVLHDG